MEADIRLLVKNVFPEYLEAKRRLMERAQVCAVKGWPDRKPVILDACELQFLFVEREMLRFEHWSESADFEAASCGSVSAISKRLLEDWADLDEKALMAQHVRYKQIAERAEDIQTSLDKEGLLEPLQAAGRDPEYRAALTEAQKTLHECDGRLAGRQAS